LSALARSDGFHAIRLQETLAGATRIACDASAGRAVGIGSDALSRLQD